MRGGNGSDMSSRTVLAVLTGTLLCSLTATPASAGDEGTGTTVGGELLATEGLVLDAPGAAPLPRTGAASWVLADLETGEVLAASNPHGRVRPASTLKILTALALLPRLEPGAAYTAQWEDANAVGSRVGLVPDATYTAHNLFEALFLVSGNDAASALANAAGGHAPTVELMNTTARDLGALGTTAVNPSGLDAPGQYTSAYDLSLLTRAAMAREDFRSYASTVKSAFPGKMPRVGRNRKSFEIYTQDRLLLNYRGAIGVKTGWTTKARGTFVGAATRNGRTLVATVMHTDFDAWREAAALLTWGFRNAGTARPVGTLDPTPVTAAGLPVAEGPQPAARDGAGTPADDGRGLPWFLQVPVVLLGVLVALRARVLLRRRLQRSRRPRGPSTPAQLRDLRRLTAVAAAAPTPAPSNAPRQRPLRGPDEPASSPSTSSTSTGTAW